MSPTSQALLGGAFTIAAVVVSWFLAARSARARQLDVVVDVVRALTNSLDVVIDALRDAGIHIPRTRYPKDW